MKREFIKMVKNIYTLKYQATIKKSKANVLLIKMKVKKTLILKFLKQKKIKSLKQFHKIRFLLVKNSKKVKLFIEQIQMLRKAIIAV